MSAANKPKLGFWQIWNMSFGFLGIQFGWGLQMANMSAIYEFLGAQPDEIPALWLAAPLTGLLVQPIIGYLSDRTWHPRYGRRKPYFLVGALLASVALLFMPNASAVWMAAGLLWILDASINVSMEPFRAFVADMLPEEQHTKGYTMQSMFIGLGAVIASALPFLLTNVFGLQDEPGSNLIPTSVRLSFYIGAFAFFGAVLYTVLSVKEYPPVDSPKDVQEKEAKKGFGAGVSEILHCIANMPPTMRQLALVQFFTWPGLFLMWFFFGGAITRTVFHYDDSLAPYEKFHAHYEKHRADGTIADFATLAESYRAEHPKDTAGLPALGTRFADVNSFQSEMSANRDRRKAGTEWGGVCFAFYSLVTFFFSFLLAYIANRSSKKMAHAVCLTFGAAGLLSLPLMGTPTALLLSMFGVGIAWASILSMPYAMLAPVLPSEKTGIYMGIFNFFIVIPEILASLFFGKFMDKVLHNDLVSAVMIGGGLLLLAAVLTLGVKEKHPPAAVTG
jgi:maltose/moltooligosaccharide transporter